MFSHKKRCIFFQCLIQMQEIVRPQVPSHCPGGMTVYIFISTVKFKQQIFAMTRKSLCGFEPQTLLRLLSP